jgi:sugar lactone lactonase YvrE
MRALNKSFHFLILSALLVSCADSDQSIATNPPALETKHYNTTILVEGSPFHGIHGLTFDANDKILVGSVVGMNIHMVDPDSGTISLYQDSPQGMADDLEFSPDGTLVWTAIILGELYARSPSGTVTRIAAGLPGLNAIAFRADGRLFASQVFLGDALHEFDISGEKPPRKIMEGMGGLNGFDFGADGKLYGPLWFKGQIVQVDVDSGEMNVIADGFRVPAAANFDSKNLLHVIDNESGEIFQVDIETGDKKLIATAPSNLDNLAFDSNDRLFVTNMSDNAIYEINRENGSFRRVVGGPLTTPAGISLDGDMLYIADLFSLSKVDINTGEVMDISRLISDHEYPVSVTANGEHLITGSSNAGMIQGYDKKSESRKWRWTGFNSPGGLLEMMDGSVLVAETGTGKILRVTGDQGTSRTVLAENLLEPMGMALSKDQQSLYVAEAGAGNLIKIELSTGTQSIIASDLSAPEAVAIHPDGSLLIAETGADRITQLKADGSSQTIATNLPLGLQGYPGLPGSFLPTGLAVSRHGSIFVSSDIDNSIIKLTP